MKRSLVFILLLSGLSFGGYGQRAAEILNRYVQVISNGSSLDGLEKVLIQGQAAIANVGTCEISFANARPNESSLYMSCGQGMVMSSYYDGRTGGAYDASGLFVPYSQQELDRNYYENIFLEELYYRDFGINYQYQRVVDYMGQQYYELMRTTPLGEASYRYYNVQSGLLAQVKDASGTSYTSFSDYRPVEGILLPYRYDIMDGISGMSYTIYVSTYDLFWQQAPMPMASGMGGGQPVYNQQLPANQSPAQGQTQNTQGETASQPSSTAFKSAAPVYRKKLALVIGNAAYQHGGALKNPVNDANGMSTLLKKLGFEVIALTNADWRSMRSAVVDFGNKLPQYDVGLFYYAGHGIQYKGENFMIPVDANIESEGQIEINCVNARHVLEQMDVADSKVNILILDACRNNPFERSWSRSGQGNGLAFMNAPTGTLIAYATAPGNVASDGSGENGLYTEALIKYMQQQGLTIEEMFKRVRVEVEQKSSERQIPWESTSLKGTFYFVNP